METGHGILRETESLLQDLCAKNINYSYKVNKINLLVYHTSEKSAIIEIFGRIKNNEIRVYISDKSPEYQAFLSKIKDNIDASRIKLDRKQKLNYSFYLSETQAKQYLEELFIRRD